jgi:AbrB family looped-hinge helix DNA binding protein
VSLPQAPSSRTVAIDWQRTWRNRHFFACRVASPSLVSAPPVSTSGERVDAVPGTGVSAEARGPSVGPTDGAGRVTCSSAHYRGNVPPMPLARSRVTAQGQVSVPAEVRRRLGVGPGSLLEWNEEGNAVVVRRSGRYTSADIHRALFGVEAPQPRSMAELKEGIRKHVRTRHARG